MSLKEFILAIARIAAGQLDSQPQTGRFRPKADITPCIIVFPQQRPKAACRFMRWASCVKRLRRCWPTKIGSKISSAIENERHANKGLQSF